MLNNKMPRIKYNHSFISIEHILSLFCTDQNDWESNEFKDIFQFIFHGHFSKSIFIVIFQVIFHFPSQWFSDFGLTDLAIFFRRRQQKCLSVFLRSWYKTNQSPMLHCRSRKYLMQRFISNIDNMDFIISNLLQMFSQF